MIPEKNIYNYATEERINKLSNALKHRQKSLTVVLENIFDQHNLSACLRSCDAVGILEVCLIYHSGQQYPSISGTSSASANKWIEKRLFTSVQECYDYLHSTGKKIFTTHLAKESVSLYDMDLTQNVALVFGNEHAGVSDEAVALADGNFLIPQVGIIQSLNISVACAVSVFEAMRQRTKANMLDNPEIIGEEFNSKLLEWVKR
jgi:tRNA (guanosine-2'-O-)-methyltransferase